MDKKNILYITIVCAVVVIVGWSYFLTKGGAEPTIDVSSYNGAGLSNTLDPMIETDDILPATIRVHIAGAVNNPGVYEMPKDSRIIDLLEKAGGGTEEAELSINLAKVLQDGEQIIILKIGETVDKTDGLDENSVDETVPEDDLLLNINTASKAKLMLLPGVGDTIAESIIQYREENGGFTDKTEIMNVYRVGEKLYENIQKYIVTE